MSILPSLFEKKVIVRKLYQHFSNCGIDTFDSFKHQFLRICDNELIHISPSIDIDRYCRYLIRQFSQLHSLYFKMPNITHSSKTHGQIIIDEIYKYFINKHKFRLYDLRSLLAKTKLRFIVKITLSICRNIVRSDSRLIDLYHCRNYTQCSSVALNEKIIASKLEKYLFENKVSSISDVQLLLPIICKGIGVESNVHDFSYEYTVALLSRIKISDSQVKLFQRNSCKSTTKNKLCNAIDTFGMLKTIRNINHEISQLKN